jgi:hypothetical protein
MCEQYEGWTNRETWACALWINNDQGLYEQVRELAQHAVKDCDSDPLMCLEESLQNLVVELLEEEPLLSPELRSMRNDIGSIWRVNFREVSNSFIQEVEVA